MKTESAVSSPRCPCRPPHARARQALALLLASALLPACALHGGLEPLSGQILDPLGRPVERVVVTIHPVSRQPFEGKLECVTTSDDLGRFSCPHMEAAPLEVGRRYRVLLEKPPLFVPGEVLVHYVPSGAGLELLLQERFPLPDQRFVEPPPLAPSTTGGGPLP